MKNSHISNFYMYKIVILFGIECKFFVQITQNFKNTSQIIMYAMYCKPTFIRNDFISQFTSDKLVQHH